MNELRKAADVAEMLGVVPWSISAFPIRLCIEMSDFRRITAGMRVKREAFRSSYFWDATVEGVNFRAVDNIDAARPAVEEVTMPELPDAA